MMMVKNYEILVFLFLNILELKSNMLTALRFYLIYIYIYIYIYKESSINQRKMVSEEIHQLEEVKRIATAVGQRKKGACTK